MEIDLDAELQKTAEDMEIAKDSLIKAGFTQEQMEQLGVYLHATIAHNQYSILKARREIKAEAAFQTRVS